jgi:hypothetical protein
MEKKRKEKKKKTPGSTLGIIQFLLIIGFIIASFNFGKVVAAASLYFSPASGSYIVGRNFSVAIDVSSADQAMNAVSGIISFPADKLEVASLSRNESIFNLWVKEPAYANSAGTINFEGVVLNPGFIGQNGKIITVTFLAKAAGTASLSFSSGLVLANDGNGTTIASSLGRANYTLAAAAAPVPPVVTPISAPIAGLPPYPIISSPANPKAIPWYSNNPLFTWPITPDITADRVLIDQSPNSHPTTVYRPPLAEIKTDNLADGIWYLHLQLRNNSGWGDIAHYQFQIDNTPPEQFTLTFVDGQASDNPRPKIILNASDALSGMDFYQIKIDDGEVLTIPTQTGNTSYALPLQDPGEHDIFAQAFDRAGNYATLTDKFAVTSAQPPIFTEPPSFLQDDEILTLKGKTYPDINLIVWLQKDSNNPRSFQIRSDKNGDFAFDFNEKLAAGTYQIWAQTIDKHGTVGQPSAKLTFVVNQPFTLMIVHRVANFPSLIIILLGLIMFSAAAFWYFKRCKNNKIIHENIQPKSLIIEKPQEIKPIRKKIIPKRLKK